MLITCPNCQSVFKLPDNNNENLKMRCSICTDVFRLGDAIVLEEDAHEVKLEKNSDGAYTLNTSLGSKKVSQEKGKGKKMFLRLFLILFFSLIAAGAGLYKYTSYLDPLKEILSSEETINEDVVAKQKEAIADFNKRVEFLNIIGLRQYIVPNEENDKFEKLAVIEGQVINNFNEPRSFVEVEASLFDENGMPLVTKKQMAGPHLSVFQLQVLGQAELEEALRDQITIMNYNIDIQPQETVPFMFIFYNPPAGAKNCNVTVVDAQLPEPNPEAEEEKK